MRRLRKQASKGSLDGGKDGGGKTNQTIVEIGNNITHNIKEIDIISTSKCKINLKEIEQSSTIISDKVMATSTMAPATGTVASGTSASGGGAVSKLNIEIFKNFDKNGKAEFLKFIKRHVKDHDNPVFDKNGEFKYGISRAIYELLWQGLRCFLKKDVILNTLNEVVGLHEDFPSMILDIINILDAETSLMTDGIQEERLMFSQIVKDLDKVISDKLIKERLEIDTLQDVGIVKNKVFYTKFIKIKTKLYYKQRRFNLFREESEGYAKLITELNQDFEEDVTASSVMDLIKSLIGCFNLDPNRVLDIIIESFETRPERRKLFIPLLRTYMPTGSIICEVLGYKFRYFAASKTPKSLLHICALLLKYNVIDLNDIYVWLTPTDNTIITEWETELNDAKEYVRKLNIIVTNKDKEPIEIDTEKVYDEEKYNANQKFGLCEALLKIGDWENAFKIIEKLPEQCVVVHENIARALIELLHISLDYLYTKKCFKNAKTYKSRLMDDHKLVQKLQAYEFSNLRNYAIPMAIALGPSLHYDTILMHKLVRILRTIINEMGVDCLNLPTPNTEAETLYYEVMTLMDSSILPSLSYLDANCPMAEEIWTVLKYFPYHFRYSLYARWKNDTYQMHPLLIIRRGNAQKSIKAQMKRISRENVKFVGRLIGKLSHCAPGFLFDYILLQIQIYDNLIGPVVDTLKYLTSLSFDCLGYCIIEALAMADRDRFKHDGTSISLWLQSLSSFCGAIFKKYNIELSGLLQYVANQLKSQKSLDLLILKEIVQKMAGVESAEEMTNEQLNAMCGGELLRGEAGYFSQVRNTKKSSQRLKDALANNDLAVTICLLMAQQKHCVIYRETAQSHLKLVGKLYDQCQDTLVQFGTFLGSTYSVDEYVERLPSIIAMLQEYHINADVAFFLARPMFTHQINQKYDQLRKADPNSKKLTTNQKLQKYLEATNLIMNPIVESVRPLHSLKVWEDISPQFLVTFWSLSMYDLQVPADSYQKEINKLKQLSLQAAEAKDPNASKNKKEQDRYISLMDKLQDERKKQQEHVDKILQRLNQQKDSWFLSRSVKSAKNETITQFLQLCLFPRCTFTALDALYCAKFVHTIHNLKAANFSTLLCYDRIFCDITYSVTSCTENEATRYGRFLCAMLETVMRWHADQATFNRECASYPGFVTKFRVSNQFSEANDHVGYENYRHVCHKWHYKITKAIVFCLDSKDYMQIRNALIILMRILPHYPVLSKLSQIIERKVEKVREDEKNKRPDLFVIASSYIGKLKLKANQMIKENDFHQVTERQQRNETNGEHGTTSTTTTSTTAITSSNANNTASNSNGADGSSSSSVAGTNIQSNNAASTNSVTSSSVTQTINNLLASSRETENGNVKQISNGDIKTEKREKDRSEKLKLNKDGIGGGNVALTSSSNMISNTTSNSNNRNTITMGNDLKEDYINLADRDIERHSSSRSLKEMKKDERVTREREKERDRERLERDRDRERNERIERSERSERSERQERSERNERNEHRSSQWVIDDLLESVGSAAAAAAAAAAATSRSKREKRREERNRNETSPTMDAVDAILESGKQQQHYHDHAHHHHHHDYDRGRDRDLSSVSNESNSSIHRRSQDLLDYSEKDSKRRKMETNAASSSANSKKQSIEEYLEMKKERGLKVKERKDQLTEEERDARKERKLGRKRERLDENPNIEHKRRRDDALYITVQNGDEDIRDREKYHSREKTPHMRDGHERSHDKFERDRCTRDDRQYGPSKSTRSRIGY